MNDSGNGDGTPEPVMHIDAIRFLRLLPPDGGLGPEYKSGVTLFLSSTGEMAFQNYDYCLCFSERSARRLADDLNRFFAGEIDITDPNTNYGRPDE